LDGVFFHSDFIGGVSDSVRAEPPARQQQSEISAAHFAVIVKVIETRATAWTPVGHEETDVSSTYSRIVIKIAGTARGE
jgi:hypothetical protein